MKRIAVALLLMSPHASGATINHGYPENFGETPSPATLTWHLATEADQRVLGFFRSGIPGIAGGVVQFSLNASTAAAAGVDWAALEAAANNPLFTRSIITFGGDERVRPANRNFMPGNFRLDVVGATIDGYRFPATQHGITTTPYINVGASMFPVVPEPGSALLMAIGLVTLLSRKRG